MLTSRKPNAAPHITKLVGATVTVQLFLPAGIKGKERLKTCSHRDSHRRKGSVSCLLDKSPTQLGAAAVRFTKYGSKISAVSGRFLAVAHGCLQNLAHFLQALLIYTSEWSEYLKKTSHFGEGTELNRALIEESLAATSLVGAWTQLVDI